MIDPLERGRDAFKRHAWTEAIEALATVDRDGNLPPADLELLGEASGWAGQPTEATEALERAYASWIAAGQDEDAARVAIRLAYQAYRRRADSIGAGWQARALRLLEGTPESPNHAWIAVYRALAALQETRLAEGVELADQAMDLARRVGADDALYAAMSFKGYGELLSGNWRPGLALIDEAAAAATSGQLDLAVASDIYCNTIAACRDVGDLQRAAQWADESERWMHRQSLGGYPGVCQVHRAELKMLHGRWAEAETEARQACVELERHGLLDAVGLAWYAVGEVRLRMGDLDAATEAFDRAYEYGHDGQPGLARLQLARGDRDGAVRSISRALAAKAGTGGTADRAARARLLPAHVDIALATGDLETARRAVEELESIATDFGRPMFEAGALTARGELLLGEENPADASPLLGRSWRLWQSTELPYESAQARLRYAEAMAAEGDQDSARRDLRAARGIFERLGATLDLQRVDALLGEEQATAGRAGVRATKAFMFTDIVTSTELVGVIGDDAWAELLRWHDREMRSAFVAHRGEEVKHTGDGFFVAFDEATDAIDCAVDTLRRLARHRREHGFAPSVRIGLHAAEATREGRDYTGRGVHIAARVGAAAEGDEILVTDGVVAAVGSRVTRFALSEERSLTLKGVDEPIAVRAVGWR